ncbi:MAG: protein-L-isoaspartate O-methyltransferase [Sphingomonadales bacterium]|nr:protein-L-isoaspartate O-methyltransferase [Sphingomonadales bacterium]
MTILQERASTARRAMIDSQLRVSGVNDPAVLAAIDAVAREDFVPAAQAGLAYIDRALPLGDGHALPAPLFHGLALSEAQLRADDRVLVVAASGYLAALAARFGCTVTTLTPAEAAAAPAGEAATLILVDGAIEQLPAALVARLAEGGRIVTGIVEGAVTRLAVGTKAAGQIALLPVLDIGVPVLSEFAAPQRWSF